MTTVESGLHCMSGFSLSRPTAAEVTVKLIRRASAALQFGHRPTVSGCIGCCAVGSGPTDSGGIDLETPLRVRVGRYLLVVVQPLVGIGQA